MIPHCNKSKSLLFLPLRTWVSDFKSSPISHVDTCQSAPCSSQNRTPWRQLPPRPYVSSASLRLFSRTSLKSGSGVTVQMFTEVLSVVLQSPHTKTSEKTPGFRAKRMFQKSTPQKEKQTNKRRAPHCLAHGTQKSPEQFVPFTTEAKLSVTL